MDAHAAQLIERCEALGRRFGARASDYDREGRFPVESFDDLKDEGLLSLMVPKAHGGMETDFATYTRAMEQLGKGDASLALAFNMHNIVLGGLAELDVSRLPERRGKRQRDFIEWMFNEAVSEKRVFASATSEPGIGASFTRLKTTYERVEGGYVLQGTKAFVSMSGYADYYVVAARRAGDDDASAKAVSYFVVDRDRDGITLDRVWDTLGMRATESNTLHLDGCFVPDERLFLGSEGLVLHKVIQEPHWLVGSYNGVYLGICDAIVDFVTGYLTGGEGFPPARGRADDRLAQHSVGALDARLAATSALVHEAARTIVERRGSREANVMIHRAKYVVGEAAPWLASEAIRLCGGTTIARRFALERHYRDARCGGLMPATSDNCLIFVGKAALGFDVDRVDESYW